MWQISQFYSCLLHAFIVLFFETTPVRCYAWIQVLYQVTMVYLFSKKMSYVPKCVPDFNAQKGEPSVTCYSLCNPQDGDEMPKTQAVAEWTTKYVVIRGQAYDITHFQHPGGSHMIDLAEGRDATVMFESAHLRLELAEKVLGSLPKVSKEEVEKNGYQ